MFFPLAEEVISYQIPAYRLPGGMVIFFAGWRAHYSLYPATDKVVSTFKEKFARYELSRGTIRFPYNEKMPVDLIAGIAKLRAKETAEGTTWFGFSTRARVVVYDKLKVKKADVDTYEKLADPKNKGLLCTRSGAHPYNLSLFGAVTEHLGEAKAEQWLKGLVANMARDPKGGDSDQIKAVASGECGIALTNSYYLARIMRSNAPDDKVVADRVGVVFPNQDSWGTHVNIAG